LPVIEEEGRTLPEEIAVLKVERIAADVQATMAIEMERAQPAQGEEDVMLSEQQLVGDETATDQQA